MRERESVLSDCTHTPLPPDSEEPAIWMQVDEITDTHMAAPLVLVGVISYTQSHTQSHTKAHMLINTQWDTAANC